jgi:hypothetical protein
MGKRNKGQSKGDMVEKISRKGVACRYTQLEQLYGKNFRYPFSLEPFEEENWD